MDRSAFVSDSASFSWSIADPTSSLADYSKVSSLTTEISTFRFIESIFTSSSCFSVVTSPSLPSFDSLANFSAA
jgi:hypothetical protein